MSETTPFEGWCILELMGHRRLGGYVTEQTVAGAGFLRIDIPNPDGETVATQLYPPTSVYCLTPTTKAVAVPAALGSQPKPVTRWAELLRVDDGPGFDARWEPVDE